MTRLRVSASLAAALVVVACSGEPQTVPQLRAPIVIPPVLMKPGLGAVWVASTEGRALRIDPDRGRVVAKVRVGRYPLDIAAGEGAVWVPSRDDGTVTRIDPRTNRAVATIKVGARPVAIAAGEGAVWVADGLDRTLHRIDPGMNVVTDRIDLGHAPGDVAVGEGAVWVVGSDGVIRIDAASRRVTDTYDGPNFRGLLPRVAVDAGAVWVTDAATSLLLRIDAFTNAVTGTNVSLGFPGNFAVAAGEGAVWVATLKGVGRIDAGTAKMTASVNTVVGNHIAIGEGAIWVADEGDDVVFQIDPATNRLVRTIRLEDAHAIAYG